MAAILNGMMPAKARDQYSDNTIGAPMHNGWGAIPGQPQASPDLDRDLPATPPHFNDEIDGVFIVHSESEDHQSAEDTDGGRDDTVVVPPQWKKTTPIHARKPSNQSYSAINSKFAAPRRIDGKPVLGGANSAAGIPLPESRVNSPLGRNTTISPVLAFRSRMGTPNLAEILSPVAEGFAKDGPSKRAAPVMMPAQEPVYDPIERTSSSNSIRSNMGGRSYTSEGIGGMTMSSQATTEEQLPDFNRPPSRGIGATSHMRGSSRGPRETSRARVTVVDPIMRRAPSADPYTRVAPSADPVPRRAPSADPYTRRAPSADPVGRRAPSADPYTRVPMATEPANDWNPPTVEPFYGRRAPSADPYTRTAPPAEPMTERAPIVEPFYGRRAPSVEPGPRRAPSADPYTRQAQVMDPVSRRAPSADPYTRQAQVVDPVSRRAPSADPYTRRAPSVEPVGRRAPSVDPYAMMSQEQPQFRRGQSVEPAMYHDSSDDQTHLPATHDLQPLRKRAPSVEPGRRRAPSIDPASRRAISVEPSQQPLPAEDYPSRRAPSVDPSSRRRVQSREPRGRRGMSVEPRPRVRFHSEVARGGRRRGSFSSNDDSSDIDGDRDDSDLEQFSRPTRFDPKSTSTHVPRRRRSIASPVTSPTQAAFNIAQISGPSPSLASNIDNSSISSRMAPLRPIIKPIERPASRNRSQSRSRGLYADTQSDFSNLAREVQTSSPPPAMQPALATQPPRGILRTTSPVTGPNPAHYQNNIDYYATNRFDVDRSEYSSSPAQSVLSSMPGMISSDGEMSDYYGGNPSFNSVAHDREEYYRREERERNFDKLNRRMDRERDRANAMNVLGDVDSMSNMSVSTSAISNPTTAKVIPDTGYTSSSKKQKELVPKEEDIWG